MMLIYTAINIPYGALMGVITPDSLERTRLSSYRFLGAFTGNLVVQTCTVWLVKYLGGGSDRLGYRYTMGLYGAAAALLFLGTFAMTRERVQLPRTQETDVSARPPRPLAQRPLADPLCGWHLRQHLGGPEDGVARLLLQVPPR